MSTWASFWTVVLIVAIAAFAVVAVLVAVGGFRDLFAMFRRYEEQQEREGVKNKD